jgi:hypothetical protein
MANPHPKHREWNIQDVSKMRVLILTFSKACCFFSNKRHKLI